MGDFGKRIERRLKRAVFGWIAGSAGADAIPPAEVDLDTVRSVVVVRPNFRMGNLLLTTPAIAALRQRLPHARIDYIGAEYLSLLANNPEVDRLIRVDRQTFTPRGLRRLAAFLRTVHYDLAIDAARGGSFLGAAVVALTRSRYRVGSGTGRYRRFFNVLVPARDGSLHKVDLLLRLLEDIGVPPVSRELKVLLTEDERGAAARVWSDLGLGSRRTVGINVGARGGKRLDPEQLIALVHSIDKDGLATLLLAGPEDLGTLAALRPRMPSACVLAPPLPVRAFAALLARCDVLVTGDTGPMHLAAAVGTPTVTMTVDPRSAYYRPLGPRHRLIAGGEASTLSQALQAVRTTITERETGNRPSVVAVSS